MKINKSPSKNIEPMKISEAIENLSNEVILKLNPLKDDDRYNVMITNGFLNQISFYHNEDEVLFFPFSSFELVDIYYYKGKTMIVLDYSPRFFKKVENCVYKDVLI